MGSRYPLPERVAGLDELFAYNLYTARRALKLTRRELSERTGIPAHAIEKIETGHGGTPGKQRRAVAIGEAVVLAEALGLKTGDLLKRSLVVGDA